MRKARADRDRRGAVWRKKAPSSPCRPCLRALLGPIPRPPGALAACLCTGCEKENREREAYHDGWKVHGHFARTHGHHGGFEVSVLEKTFDGE